MHGTEILVSGSHVVMLPTYSATNDEYGASGEVGSVGTLTPYEIDP